MQRGRSANLKNAMGPLWTGKAMPPEPELRAGEAGALLLPKRNCAFKDLARRVRKTL